MVVVVAMRGDDDLTISLCRRRVAQPRDYSVISFASGRSQTDKKSTRMNLVLQLTVELIDRLLALRSLATGV